MSEVTVEREGNVGYLTLRAPERRNAFSVPMVEDLLEACDALDRDQQVGCVVVRAAGETFCSGAHRDLLAEVGRDPAESGSFERLSSVYRAFVRVGELLAPTIAAVRGHAVGAGVNLMMSTDLRIIAHEAHVITGFQRIGLHPGGGHFVLLGRSAGREATAALSVFGLPIDGRRAVEVGLAWEALPEPEVEPRAAEIAAQVAADPQLARSTVRSMRLELGPPAMSAAAALELERGQQMWSLRRQGDRRGS